MYNNPMEHQSPDPDAEKPKTSIEAGHLYSPEHYLQEGNTRTDEALRGLAIATRLRDRLDQIGVDSKQVFFVDDISPRHEQQKSMDAWRWQMFMNRPIEQATNLIQHPLQIMHEYDAIAPGLEIVQHIKEKALISSTYRLSRDGRNLIYGEGALSRSIPILGYHNFDPSGTYDKDYPDLPSCEVMDMSTYRKKLKETGQTITLLPEWYVPEQQRVHTLFELLGETPPIVVGFYNEQGLITSTEDWSNGHLEEIKNEVSLIN